MSTNDRYGGLVWAAICTLDQEALQSGSSYWLSVSDVAKRAGVSMPTARKYLRVLIKQEFVAQIGNNRTTLYALSKVV